MCVSKIGLSKVGEAVEDEDVAEVEGGVDLHQLENDKHVDKRSLSKVFKPGRACVRRRAASSKPFVEAGRQMSAGRATCTQVDINVEILTILDYWNRWLIKVQMLMKKLDSLSVRKFIDPCNSHLGRHRWMAGKLEPLPASKALVIIISNCSTWL